MTSPLSFAHGARRSVGAALALLLAFAFLPPPPRAAAGAPRVAAAAAQGPQVPVIAPGSAYRQTNLVSDVPGLAPVLDPLLVNPWGISLTDTSAFRVANNGTSTSTVYRGDAGGVPLAVYAALPHVNIPGGLPTGTVGNTTADFVVTSGTASGPASFIFASITGNISGWNSTVPAPGSATAVVMNSQPGHVYTGLAIGDNGSNKLYAADFANGHIDVFDAGYNPTTVPGGFADPSVPNTPANRYHPFNIQAVGGSLYVTYAKVGAGGLDEEGVGNGYVRKFDMNGVRDAGFAIDGGRLNSPWGVTPAPASFGIFGNALLVGNFGRGAPSVHAYNASSGAFLGTLQDESGNGIVIDELRGLKFGNGGDGGDANALYFTAGIGDERHGLFGSLRPTTATATSLIRFATDNFATDEAGGHVDFTVIRTGDTSGAATVNYNTFDRPPAGTHASQKSDYEIALGTLAFAPGETSKTFRVLLVDDKTDESDEVIDLMLSNVTGAGVGLGSPNRAELRVLDNDTGAAANPIDQSQFFVRQHYLDFLNREPDPSGFAFWVNEIESCGADAACREAKRVNVSAAFFLSIEFQRTGYLAYLTHRAAFGTGAPDPTPLLYGEFMRDTQALQRGYVFGEPGAEVVLEANKAAYFDEFVTRPEFATRYPAGMTNEQYVNALLDAADLTPAEVRLFVVQMTNSQEPGTVVPTTSTGDPRPVSFGSARFQLNQAQTAMTFAANVVNIDVTGAQTADLNDNLTAAHIHAGPAVAPGVNGPVVWGFFGTPFNDNNPNDQVVIPAGGVGGDFRGKWDAPEGNNTTLAAQLSNLREGRAYVNFHTRQFPGGEIRGNFTAADAFRNSLVAGLNAATETRATVLRKVAEAEELQTREFNRAFVAMQYFGYLRRDPDPEGYNFWLNKLNAFNGDFIAAEMVKAFISSAEYRQRFGQ